MIDDLTYDLSGPSVQSSPDELKIALRPGSHKVWIDRRGFEPIEDRFQAIEGKDHTLRAEWRGSPGLAEQVEEQPEPASPTPTPTPPPTPKASDVAESAQPGEPGPMEPETPALDPEAEKRLAAEARYAEAMKPVDALIAAWDFNGASAALAKLQFPEQDLAARLAAWRDSVERLVDLKARIVTAINTADPPLKTTALLIRGAGRDLVKADEDGLTTKLRSGKPQPLPWPDVGPRAIEKLIELARGLAPFSSQTKKVPVPLPETQPDDRLAAGVLALASGDPTAAEKHFEQARSLGAEIGPYLAPLAATAFAQARRLTDEKKFPEADDLLANLEAKYADTAWFRSNRAAVDALRAEVRAGIHESEAETLYSEAAELFKKEQLFDVKPLIEKLKNDYAHSRPVTDAARKPSFAELEQSTANLGRFITVRQDGQGDFTSIQAAIDAAPRNSLVEIQDNGPYNEKVNIPRNKEQFILRGGKGCWPIITSVGPVRDFPFLMRVTASQVVLDRLILAHGGAAGQSTSCLTQQAEKSTLRVRHCVLYGGEGADAGAFSSASAKSGTSELDHCVIIGGSYGSSYSWSRLLVKNSVWFGNPNYIRGGFQFHNVVLATSGFGSWSGGELRGCTIAGVAKLGGEQFVAIDCIMPSVESGQPGARIEHCNVYGPKPFVDLAKPGKGCFSAPPQFVDPKNFDFRLNPISPCRNMASDGGDVGCRYTPEMIEMLLLAFELRTMGVVKF